MAVKKQKQKRRTLKAIKEDLTGANNAVTKAMNELSQAEETQRLFATEYVERKFKTKVGDVVTSRGYEYLVREMKIDMIALNQRPWVIGSPKKRNGEWSLRKRSLFDHWEK